MSDLDKLFDDIESDIKAIDDIDGIHLPNGSYRVISKNIERTIMENGTIKTLKIHEPTFDKSGTILNSSSDVGGLCFECKDIVAKTNYYKCTRCRNHFCNNCIRILDEQPYCKKCRRKMIWSKLIGKGNHNGRELEKPRLLES